jgi:hypothetical protein
MPESARAYQARHMRGSKMPVPDLVVILRRMGDEIHAGLNSPDAGERAALGNTH